MDFEEFEALMNSPVVAKPNFLNRVSVQPRAIPAAIPEAGGDATLPDALPANSPVSSLMTAMESKWMAGQVGTAACAALRCRQL